MDSIELMISEHDNILAFIQTVRNACVGVLDGEEICVADFRTMIDFVRNYADKHHHGKEEKFLFQEMVNHLGRHGTNLITHGMLVEHDLGRLYMFDLEAALNAYEESPTTESKLDILANAVGYTTLLQRHAEKENAVVFTFGKKNLPPAVLEDLNQRAAAYEKEAEEKGIQKKYMDILKTLSEKYSSKK